MTLHRSPCNKATQTPNPKASLGMLLKHVYDTVLVPTHRTLRFLDEYAQSTLSFYEHSGYENVADEFEDRPAARLSVYRRNKKEPLFTYNLSFDGETYSEPAALWSEVKAPRYLPSSEAAADAATPQEAMFAIERFDTLDMGEAVKQVQQDLLEALDQFL